MVGWLLTSGGGFSSPEILYQGPGIAVLRFEGPDAHLLTQEAGGHRVQRVPPTEKRGRVHTSTITVAVIPEVPEVDLHLDPRDLEISTTKGSGPGGQHRNKVETAVVVKHLPSGTTVRVEDSRSQSVNRERALNLLRGKLLSEKQTAQRQATENLRKTQVGSGQRGDKTRTIQTQNDRVTNHLTGMVCSYWKDYSRGRVWLLWRDKPVLP